MSAKRFLHNSRVMAVPLVIVGQFLCLKPTAGDNADTRLNQEQMVYTITRPITFIQITDTHISSDITKRVDESCPYDNLKHAVDEINGLQPRPHFVIHTGDIADSKGFVPEYKNFKKEITRLSVPIRYALGNHDNCTNFLQVVLGEKDSGKQYYYYSFDQENGHFVVLDSRTGKSPGNISEDQLKWLREDLEKNKDKLTFVFLHHHVMRIQSQPNKLDSLMLQNHQEFLDIIDRFPNVKFVVNGHVHLPKTVTKGGKTFICTPSLAYQFSPVSVKLERVNTPPCYRIFTIDKQGQVKVHLKPLGEEAQEDLSVPRSDKGGVNP